MKERIKIVIVIPSLASGGAEKSLVNLLNSMDYTTYSVDLVLLSKTGLFLNLIPKEVTLINFSNNYATFTQSMVKSVLGFIAKAQFGLAYNRLLFTLKNKVIKNTNRAEQAAWKHHRVFCPKLVNHYDVAIGYLEKTSIYFAVDCIKAKSKIGFIRTDYSKLGLDKNFDKKYFQKLNYLCTNGDSSLQVLATLFPEYKTKLRMIMNVVSTKLIRDLAMEKSTLDSSKTNIVSVGRLDSVKGFDLAIEACAIIKKSHPNINWHIIGEGIERANLQAKIEALDLKKEFFLLGEKQNPYPYMNAATVYAQTSLHEGRSSTINEAKILNKAIVATNFDSIFEQIQNEVNGVIVEKNPPAIAKAILELINDQQKSQRLSIALSTEKLGTEEEIQKFYELLKA